MRRRPVAVAVACAALVLPASAAAHTGVDHTSPRAGSTVTRSLSVAKVFFEGRVSDATLVGKRNGSKVSRGDGMLADRGRQVRARLRTSRSGRHSATVRWLSRDGHVLSRTWSFRIR